MLSAVSRAALYVSLVWAPLAGADGGWALAVLTLLVAVALAAWLGGMLAGRRLEWRRTPLDLPITLLTALVLVQLTLGNGALVRWALAPPPPAPELRAPFPAPLFSVGTVTPAQTLRSLLLGVLCAAVYYLVVHQVRTRRQVSRLVRALLALGGLMALLSPFSAPFVNPDHLSLWLAMLICLGVGWLVARGRETRRAASLVVLGTMAIALAFTRSRSGVLSLGVALVVMLVLLGATGRTRWSFVVTGVVFVTMAGYGSWIGFGPLPAKSTTSPDGAIDRRGQHVSSLSMLKDFPVLGVGLGGYAEISPRYQPFQDRPHDGFDPYARNDVLQFVLETGIVGAAIGLFFLRRLVADLGAAHLFGWGACPVDGGAGEAARRNDPLSVGVALGALGGALAMLGHSTLDSGMWIPVTGVLAGVLLGLATVAQHTRLVAGREQVLTAVRTVELRGRAWLPAGALALAAVGLLAGWSVFAVRVTLDPSETSARLARALARQDAAWGVWTGRTPSASVEEARRGALGLLAEGRADLHAALRQAPTNPALHDALARLEAVDAVVGGGTGAGALAETLAHAARALALAPEDARLYASSAQLAMRELPQLGLQAAREATRREPGLIPALVDRSRTVGLTEAEWLTLVPDAAVDRLDLATHLEDRHLVAEGLAAYRAALAGAGELERPLYRWMLAQALLKSGLAAAAQSELEEALRADARNPELQRALGERRAARGDPDALDNFRFALMAAEERARVRPTPAPFIVKDERLLGIAQRRAGQDWTSPARYRRALARYLLERTLWEQAAQEWQRLALDDPKDADARFSLGLALEGAGHGPEALERYRQAVALAPGHPGASQGLARLSGRR